MEELRDDLMPQVFFTQLRILVDSADATAKDWLQYAKIIEAYYPDFDGFVFVHGY